MASARPAKKKVRKPAKKGEPLPAKKERKLKPPSDVLAFRVPETLSEEITRSAKKAKVSVSAYLRAMVETAQQKM